MGIIVQRHWYAWNDARTIRFLFIGSPKNHLMQDDLVFIFKLIQVVRVNGNIFFLLDNSCSMDTIVRTIQKLKKKNILYVLHDRMKLTEEGEVYFRSLSMWLKKRGLYKYLCSDNSVKSIQISQEDIYIPKKRKGSR